MQKHKTKEDYLRMFATLERDRAQDEAYRSRVREACDRALSAQDADAFIALDLLMSEKEDVTRMSRSQEMLRLKYLVTAVRNEQSASLPLLIRNVRSFDALQSLYTRLTLYLRRIEFDTPDAQEAYDFLRTQEISPFVVSAVLYSLVSVLGHREEVLLKLAEDALSHQLLFTAYGFLRVIEQPHEETLALMKDLASLLSGGEA